MESLAAIGAAVVGIAIRIVIPLLVTVLIAWGLRKLDARWQHEAEEQRERVLRSARTAAPALLRLTKGGNGRKPPPVSPNCWEWRHCPPETRNACPAYLQAGIPCWQVFRGTSGRLPEECLECDVFRVAPVPAAH